jgi:DNA-binding PadR family transcriptional regulator
MASKGTTPTSLEAGVRKRARRDSIRRALLSTLAIAGALPIAIAAPKVLSLLKREHIDAIIPADPRQRLYETASRLRRKGLIEFRTENGRKKMVLTPKGRAENRRIESHVRSIPQPRKWDKRWRIIIFDIPEKRKQLRDRIRELVRGLGFYRLQDSVWVFPFDCEEIITLLKTEFRMGRDMLYIIADAIEYDIPLRQHYGLPLQ